MEIFYEGKQYDCIEIDYDLAAGDTDYCRDETWLAYYPKENIVFKIHEVSYRGRSSKGYTDITKIELDTDKFNESVTGVHTDKL